MKITKQNYTNITRSKKISVEAMENKGYTLLEELFCDNSGFGTEDELALTYSQMMSKVKETLNTHPVLYTAITGVGQFQIYLGLFIK